MAQYGTVRVVAPTARGSLFLTMVESKRAYRQQAQLQVQHGRHGGKGEVESAAKSAGGQVAGLGTREWRNWLDGILSLLSPTDGHCYKTLSKTLSSANGHIVNFFRLLQRHK
jgi:hypothetical protein